jgi:hypothetical protein
MTDLTVRKAMRYFVLTELMAIVIVGVGWGLKQNGLVISFGLLLMMGGIVFLAVAGNLKAQERLIESVEKARQEQETYADEVGTETRGRDFGGAESNDSTADDPGSKL